VRGYQRLKLHLTKTDEQILLELLQGGVQQVRVVVRALALLQLSRGGSAPTVARSLEVTPKTVRDIGKRLSERRVGSCAV
jgi:putative transposase